MSDITLLRIVHTPAGLEVRNHLNALICECNKNTDTIFAGNAELRLEQMIKLWNDEYFYKVKNNLPEF